MNLSRMCTPFRIKVSGDASSAVGYIFQDSVALKDFGCVLQGLPGGGSNHVEGTAQRQQRSQGTQT